MTYVVLARKYRPQSLTEVIGQDAVVKTLTNAITLRRIHHAYLFTGARGVGKTSIARILAKSLNCEQGPTPTPCGTCTACVEITKSSSPDVLEIDGASNTSVDDVRDLRETVKYLPSRGKHKVYIIDEVHMLSTSAFNALLKTLEEPPEHVIFVFATTEPHKIPITILSRCQRFDFRRVPQQILAQRLTAVASNEGIRIDATAIQLVAKAADGSVRDSMSLLDQVIAFCGNDITVAQAQSALGLLDREKVRGLLAGILGRDRERVSALVSEAFIAGADLSEIAERLVEAVRDLALVKMTGGKADTLSGLLPEELAELSALTESLSTPDLHRLFNIVVKTAEDTARSAFAHLTFEMGLLRACDLEPVAALADLVNELRGNAPPSKPTGAAPPPRKLEFTPPSAQRMAQAPEPARAVAPPSPPEASRTALADAPKAAPVQTPASQAARTAAPTAAAPTEAAPAQTPQAEPPRDISAASSPAPALADPAAPRPPVPTDYRTFAAAVVALKPRIGAALENVACTAFSTTEIRVRVPAGNEVFGDMLRDRETLEMLAALTEKLFGQRVAFTMEEAVATNNDTLAEARRKERQQEVSQLKTSGAEHPIVRKVLDALGGEIRGVKVTAALSHPVEDYD